VVESSDDAIVSKNLDGVISSWNRGAERIFGYMAEEAVGQPITIIIPPDRLDEERMILARIGRGERVDHFETVRRRKDGGCQKVAPWLFRIIAAIITQRLFDEAKRLPLLTYACSVNWPL